jgi:hypothetical protein
MWAVYISQGDVYARKYTGTWGAITTLYDNTKNTANTDNSPPCVVVGVDRSVHVIYGDGTETGGSTSAPKVYYKYFDGVGWSTTAQLDELTGSNYGNFYPTLSLDTATGNVYAFWVENHATTGLPYKIMGKVNVSGVWTSLDFGTQTADYKYHLNSVYSVSGESYVCFQWTQNQTGTIDVIMDKIPEFGEVVVPVLFMMLVFAVYVRRSTKRGELDD